MVNLERLGLASDQRVVVVHVDDLGMSAAANRGGVGALEATATCGSIMVPGPGFEEIAEIAQSRPELDLGVHLTLNAEWEGLRWGPLSDRVPGLVSPDGGMWRSTAETVANASVEEVERELRAQIDRAYRAGIDVTHLDSHMGTVFDLKFIEIYFALGREYRLPLFIPRADRRVLAERGMSANLQRYLELIDGAEASGFPVFDHFDADSLGFQPGAGAEHNRRRIEALPGGLSYLITHCAQGDEELASICADWRQRDEERRIYSDGTMAAVMAAEGIRTIGMRPLRDCLRERI